MKSNQETARKRNNPTTLILLQVLLDIIPKSQNEVCVMRWLRKYGFDQAYLNDTITNRKYSFPVIYLRFYLNNGEPLSINNYLINNRNFIDIYDLDINSVVYVFKVPEIYLEDYEIFMQGKYSKHTNKFKQLFFEDPNFMAIFNKDPKLKSSLEEEIKMSIPDGAEVWSIWSPVTDFITQN